MTSLLELLIVLAVVAGLVLFISAPLRRLRPSAEEPAAVAELEAARDAKYRELRDAELDYRTGKLSDEDYAELDTALRAEAIEILRGIDRATIDGR
jgi:type II secretory pathway pseudopilin PulG